MSSAPSLACWRTIGISGDRSCALLEAQVHCRNCPVFARAATSALDRPTPAGYVDAQTLIVAAIKPVAVPERALLVVRLGAERLALPVAACEHVLEVPPIRAIPHRARDVVRGLLSVRGEIVLCVALADLLKVTMAPADAPGDRARVVVLASEGQRWAFVADEVFGVEQVREADMTSVPVTIARGLAPVIESVATVRGATVGVVAMSALTELLRRRVG